MVRKVRGAMIAMALGTWAGWVAPRCLAQDLPAAPVPVNPSPAPSGPTSPAPASTLPPPPATYIPPPPPTTTPPLAPLEDRNGPVLRGDPLLDRPGSRPPGWFADLDMTILVPHISNSIAGNVNVGGLFTDTVQLPVASLDWTVAPHFVLGYRLEQGEGALSIGYRGLSTTGEATLGGFDLDGGPGFLKSRLDMNVVDLDYSSQEYSLGSCWLMDWSIGLRIGDVFFDSHAVGNFIEQRTSNEYVGAGPRIGLSLWRTLGTPELSAYAHVDGSALLGNVKQTYQEAVVLPDGSVVGGSNTAGQDQAVPVLNAEIGLCWAPRFSRHSFRFTGGYQYEQWWYVGQDNGNHADILLQGVFLRGEWSF